MSRELLRSELESYRTHRLTDLAASAFGIHRKPDESDCSLRQRCYDVDVMDGSFGVHAIMVFEGLA